MGRRRTYVKGEMPKTQQAILEKFGDQAVKNASVKYCNKCKIQFKCTLLPLTLDGSICPYYGVKEG